MSHNKTPNQTGGYTIPVLSDSVSSDDMRKQATKLGFENDRLKRVVDTQITSVDSLMQSNTNLRADRDRLLKALELVKRENRVLDAEYGDVLNKHNLLVGGYTRKITGLEAELKDRNAQLYAASVLMDSQKAKLLEKEILLREMSDKYNQAKRQIDVNNKAPKAEPLFRGMDNIALAIGGRLDGGVGFITGTVLKLVSSLTVLQFQLPNISGALSNLNAKIKRPAKVKKRPNTSGKNEAVKSKALQKTLDAPETEEKGNTTKLDASLVKDKFEKIAKELKQRAEKRKVENLKKRRSKLWNSNLAVTGMSNWKKGEIVDFSHVANPS